jgi:alkylhydroperoxidase/carboxymuconolactone decarboxylase family protein YurZ
MGWVQDGGFASIFGLRPQLFGDYRAFEAAVCGALDSRMVELCRARVAYLLGARTAAMDPANDCERACLRLTDKFVLDPHGVSDEDTAAVAAHLPPAAMVALIEASALSARHKLVIRYTDAFLTDPASIGADLREAMRREFAAEEIVELTAGLALFMGFSKIAVVLGTAPESMPVTILPTPMPSHARR